MSLEKTKSGCVFVCTHRTKMYTMFEFVMKYVEMQYICQRAQVEKERKVKTSLIRKIQVLHVTQLINGKKQPIRSTLRFRSNVKYSCNTILAHTRTRTHEHLFTLTHKY